MDNQKVVVILLLLTIILSIVSVILTVTTNVGSSKTVEKQTITNQGPSAGQISFKIAPTSERGVSG